MNISHGPGLPDAAEMAARVGGIHLNTLDSKLYWWTGAAWAWLRALPGTDGAAGTFLKNDGTFGALPVQNVVFVDDTVYASTSRVLVDDLTVNSGVDLMVEAGAHLLVTT